jgi:hypothetical protein
VLDNFAENTAVTTADDKDLLGVGVGVHGEVGDHFLVSTEKLISMRTDFNEWSNEDVREFIALSALNDIVQNQDSAVVTALKDENVLVLRFLVVEDFLDLEGHGLTGPHVRGLGEPAICRFEALYQFVSWSTMRIGSVPLMVGCVISDMVIVVVKVDFLTDKRRRGVNWRHENRVTELPRKDSKQRGIIKQI